MTEPERLDPDWEHYPDTVLAFEATGEDGEPVRIDLRLTITERERRALATLGLGRFAVITARDPRGRDLPAGANRVRQAELEHELKTAGVRYVRVEACSPDREHCEESVAAELPELEARQLARRYGQVAIFWFDGRGFWLVGALASGTRIALPHNENGRGLRRGRS